MLLLKHSLEGAVGILVSHEIEKAGIRAAHRIKEAFGNLAKDAKESINVDIDVENNSGEVIIHIKYAGIEVAGADDRVDPIPSNHINHGSMKKEDSAEVIQEAMDEIDEQMIYSGDEEPAEINPEDIELIDDVHERDPWEADRREIDGGLATLMMEDDDLNGPERHIDTV